MSVEPNEWFGVIDSSTDEHLVSGYVERPFVNNGCLPIVTAGHLTDEGNLRMRIFYNGHWNDEIVDPRNVELPTDFVEFVRSNLSGIKERWF